MRLGRHRRQPRRRSPRPWRWRGPARSTAGTGWPRSGSAGGDQATWFAEHGGESAGMINAYRTGDDTVTVTSLWAAPGHRHLGVADVLVGRALEWAEEHGAARVRLWVVERNDEARDFYRRWGFRPTGREIKYEPDPRMVEIELERLRSLTTDPRRRLNATGQVRLGARGAGPSFAPWTSSSPTSWPPCRRRAAGSPRTRSSPAPGRSTRPSEYPQDLFEVFRDAGLLGLCIPTEIGGGGAGILGLTIAIEEVAKYSNAAALMLLLTRLPTGPVMIAGSPRAERALRRADRRRAEAGRVLPVRAPGRQRRDGHAHQGGARRRRLGPQRHQVLDLRRGPGRLVHGLRQDVAPT